VFLVKKNGKSVNFIYMNILFPRREGGGLMPLSTISYIVVVSFIGGADRSIQRKPLTCLKSLTNFIT